MRRFFTYLVAVPLAALVVVFAVVNREPVTVDTWPLPYALELPLAGVVLISMGIGIVVGGTAAWLQSLARRHELKVRARQAEDALQREAESLRARLAQAESRAAAPPPPSGTGPALPPPGAGR